MRARTAWPMKMPAKDPPIAIAPGNAVAAVKRPDAVILKASATVATVKNTPSACTSSSFSMPIACMTGIEPDADDGSQHQRPQPPDDVAQIGADEGLPDVGDDRRHDDDGERLARWHGHREQAHRHRRQAEPDHALDETGEREHRGDKN